METLVKEKPSVDVILPNYNKAKFLEEAINSVVNQTYKNWHLYIVDDCSSDESKKVIDKFLNFKNITTIKLIKNKGPSFCRNYGMRISKSKYISFIDSDDGWQKDKLEKQINFMEENNLSFTYTDFTPFFENEGKKKFIKKTSLRDRFDYKTFIKDSSINTTTMIISRSILNKHRFKKVKRSEDYLFKCELLKNNNIAKKLNENLAFYRILTKSRSSQRLKSFYWLWYINKKYNKMNFFQNITSIFLNKYFLIILKKKKSNLFIDDQFTKPQAFHENSTYRLGGITTFILLSLVFLYTLFFERIFFSEYIYFCTFLFILGIIDDFKINILPKFRLLVMTSSLLILIVYHELYITKSGLEFLNNLLEIDIFALLFICLCFLFIINGSNLIDGFNGLLGIHSLIILAILYFINFDSKNMDLAHILFYFCLIILIFLKFNFPKAQIFFGDGGSYLIGTFVAISVIKTSILNPLISPFFFCILLFYLFFEVFFSFFRKIFFVNQSPLLPDSKHLHMLLYKFFLKKNKTKLVSNYTVSIYINLIYLLLVLPAILLMSDGLFCRYYFLFLTIVYIYFYKKLYTIAK